MDFFCLHRENIVICLKIYWKIEKINIENFDENFGIFQCLKIEYFNARN